MVKRWMLYGAALIGGIVFYFAYREWFAWFTLMAILFFPVAALVLSLPAMSGLRLHAQGPRRVEIGEEVRLDFVSDSRLPAPPCRNTLLVTRNVTGESWTLKEGAALPTQHCGQLSCTPSSSRVYDYLGLFRLKIRQCTGTDVYVWPAKVPVTDLPSLARFAGKAWKPKPGGGFAENHEIRLYRPGDKLNQVHWKLSAKTGKLMMREAMEPVRDAIRIEMTLRGTPEELDMKFGQLLWLSQYLLEKDIGHYLRVLTGNGVVLLPVMDGQEQEKALEILLAEPFAPEGETLPFTGAAWQYRIGGGPDA